MRNLLTLLVVAISAFYTTSASAGEVPDIPSWAVRIYVNADHDDDKPDYYGSGTIISPDLVITNYHVVEERRQDPSRNSTAVQVRFRDGSRSWAAILKVNKSWDVALLRIHRTKLKPINIGNRPKAGDTLKIHGFGFDYEYRTGAGTVYSEFMYPKGFSLSKDFFEITNMKARQGDSGGAVTDANGNLAGMLWGAGKYNDEDIVFTNAVSIDRIRKVCGDLFPQTATPIQNYILKDESHGEVDRQLRVDPMGELRAPQTREGASYNRIQQRGWRGRSYATHSRAGYRRGTRPIHTLGRTDRRSVNCPAVGRLDRELDCIRFHAV
jgi:S1-C subfamily serine protease